MTASRSGSTRLQFYFRNVDERVLNEQGLVNKPPHRSGLKGGYWGPDRNRCRPMTVDHNEWHTGHQVGLRGCAEALLEVTPHRE